MACALELGLWLGGEPGWLLQSHRGLGLHIAKAAFKMSHDLLDLLEKKAGLGASNCCWVFCKMLLNASLPLSVEKNPLPGHLFLSQHFPWHSHSALFVILYVAMENVRINFPCCLKRAPFAVQVTVFLYFGLFLNQSSSLNSVEKVV